MQKTYKNGVLRAVKDDGSWIELDKHPAYQRPWASEDEAMSYPLDHFAFHPAKTEKLMSPVAFKMLFTPQERNTIKKSNDEIVQDFFELLNDPRLNEIDVNSQVVQDAVRYLEKVGLINDGRADEILGG